MMDCNLRTHCDIVVKMIFFLAKGVTFFQRRKKNRQKAEVFDFSALRMIHDPQGMMWHYQFSLVMNRY